MSQPDLLDPVPYINPHRHLYENCTVIVRAAGERTEDVLTAMLADEVGADSVHKVKEGPFKDTFRRAIELSIDANRKWTLFFDADILVDVEALREFVQFADIQPENTFTVTARIFDKLFNDIRRAGVRICRTELIKYFWTRSRMKEFCEARPDTNACRMMEVEGYPTIHARPVVGLHDFEQAYSDVFRKCYMHAHKHQKHVAALLQHWHEWKKDDFDYQVATWGVAAALIHPQSSMNNARNVPKDLYRKLMDDHPDKPPLDLRPETARDIRNIIARELALEKRRRSLLGRIRRKLCRMIGEPNAL